MPLGPRTIPSTRSVRDHQSGLAGRQTVRRARRLALVLVQSADRTDRAATAVSAASSARPPAEPWPRRMPQAWRRRRRKHPARSLRIRRQPLAGLGGFAAVAGLATLGWAPPAGLAAGSGAAAAFAALAEAAGLPCAVLAWLSCARTELGFTGNICAITGGSQHRQRSPAVAQQ